MAIINGTPGNDTRIGTPGGSDDIRGLGGNDTLNSGPGGGEDLLTGGPGADVFVLNASRNGLGADSTEIVDFNAAEGDRLDVSVLGISDDATLRALRVLGPEAPSEFTFYVYYNNVYDAVALQNVTAAQFGAADFAFATAATDDTINGSAGIDDLIGGLGNDRLNGGDSGDRLFGAGGNDTLIGGLVGDVLHGAGGNDSLDGGTENDSMLGGEGNDTLRDLVPAPGTDSDALDGGAGEDRLVTDGRGSVAMAGGVGNDTFVLGLARDAAYDATLITDFAPAALDVIDIAAFGIPEIDTLRLLAPAAPSEFVLYIYQNDVYDSVTVQGVTVAQLLPADLVFATAVLNDSIAGSAGIDDLFGGLGNDRLDGSGSGDRLFGEAGNDTLLGGDGDDTLVGAVGADSLAGGAGADLFVYRRPGDTGPGPGTRDTIANFTPGQFDRIDLAAIDGNTATPLARDGFVFIGTAPLTAAGQVAVSASGANTVVLINTDADATAEMTILLIGQAPGNINAASFIL